ncbi:FdtA/QdtA family cupin domain-containing protein [Agromyces sp. SYSU K20354]|uniref:sugar 3,4-ketoisomerase n=1 Tax=Agromyces cavernae TaxID=2898659 RepID=UPI001E429B4E|nr:FdtA/QdtA family cupin domain-containing protein [Agromyces cavernae]MCD2444191.1 FdtA/QdtA family cupin domain-containing protein [Agromyces cavernae]
MSANGESVLLDGAVRVLELESFRDHRGSLTPITLDDADFSVARTFVVNAPRGAVRGGHAHRQVRQVLFRASGVIDVDFSHRGERARVTLDADCPAVLIEPGVWAQQTYLDDGSTLIVFADGPYDSAEYVRGDPVESGASS